MLVRAYVDERSLGTVLSPPFQMRCSDTAPGREPDLLFVAKSNRDRIQKTFLDGPADLAVEIISPESRTRDTIDKLREYESGGVMEYWVIDPAERVAAFYQRGDAGQYEQKAVQVGVYRSGVIEQFWLRTDWLWTRPKLSTLYAAWGLA